MVEVSMRSGLKIKQIIPALENLRAECIWENCEVYDNNGGVKNGQVKEIYNVICLALIENADGDQYIEPVIFTSEMEIPSWVNRLFYAGDGEVKTTV